jgi:cytochrome c-type biogenesis protein CcmH/NrfG
MFGLPPWENISKTHKIIAAVVIALIIVVVAYFAYTYYQSHQASTAPTAPTAPTSPTTSSFAPVPGCGLGGPCAPTIRTPLDAELADIINTQ